MSFICKCGKEYSKEHHYKNHIKKCTFKEEEVVTVEEEVVAQENVLDDATQRKIKKLRDARSSTFDAQSRHNIDLEIKELESGK